MRDREGGMADGSRETSAAVGALAGWAAQQLAATSDSPRLDAELLLGHVASLRRSQIIGFPERNLEASAVRAFEAAVARRARGEPLALITGRREFYALPLAVSAAVLVPRPDTEALVDAAIDWLADRTARVLDLGTGSGAIALALKSARPQLAVTAVDDAADALAVARDNGARLGLAIRWLESDWFAALGGERFDLIVSNPPYVRSADEHFERGLAFEPRHALDGGVDGLDAYRAILAAAAAHLNPDGLILLEHGYDQRDALAGLGRTLGYRVASLHDDLAGLPRAIGLEAVAP